MFYETREEADKAFERLMNAGVINWTYYVDYIDGAGFYITTWDYNENWD